MKLVILVTSNIYKDPRILKQARIAKENNIDVKVIGRSPSKEQNLFDLNFENHLIEIENKGNLLRKVIERIIFGLQLYKHTIRINPDIIHANDFDTLLFAVLAKKKTKAKLIYDAHEIYSKNGLLNNIKILSKSVEVVEKILMKNVDTFITVSFSAKDYYQKKKYPLEANVVTNAPYAEIQNLEMNKDTSKFKVLYHGMMTENRGYEEFVNSSEYISNNVLIELRGFGPNEDNLKDIVKSNSYQNVKFHKSVEIKDLISSAAQSNVGVVLTKPISANYKYTVSNKIFEYLHAGLPLILSPVEEHIRLNKIYNFGIVLNEVTPEEIGSAINLLNENKELYMEFKNNAIEAAYNLTWEIEGQKLVNIYNESLRLQS